MELSVQNLRLSYPTLSGDPINVLNIDRFGVASGESVGILGPSGAGKTSFLYTITGIERPKSGSVIWNDTEITLLPERERDRWRRHNIGIVFQDFYLFPGMSVIQNVLVPAILESGSRMAVYKKKALKLLEYVGVILPNQPIETLSRGEKQRVAIARALLRNPLVLIADEPTASLDKDTAASIIKLILALQKKIGFTLMVVSHDSVLIDSLNSVYLIRNGELRTLRKAQSR